MDLKQIIAKRIYLPPQQWGFCFTNQTDTIYPLQVKSWSVNKIPAGTKYIYTFNVGFEDIPGGGDKDYDDGYIVTEFDQNSGIYTIKLLSGTGANAWVIYIKEGNEYVKLGGAGTVLKFTAEDLLLVKVIPELSNSIKNSVPLLVNKLITMYCPVEGNQVEYPLYVYKTVDIKLGIQCYDNDLNYYEVFEDKNSVLITLKESIPEELHLLITQTEG